MNKMIRSLRSTDQHECHDIYDRSKEVSMIDRTCVSHRRMAGIVAVMIFTALALPSAMPALAQTPPCTPGLIVDFCSDVPAAQGFLLDKGVYTTIEAPGALTSIPFGINNGGQI